MNRLKITGMVLLFVVIASLVFILFVQRRNEVHRKEWLQNLNQNMEDSMKSNGLVKVGFNTWALPNTNQIHSTTNNHVPK